jgi:predicted transcriptional regulator
MKGGADGKEKGDRRPDLYIVARFLERLWLDGKDHSRASLQAAVGLNYNLFTWYMEWLQSKELVNITSHSEKDTVVITRKGLEAYHGFVVWVREIVGDIGPKKRAGNKPYDPPGQ